MTTDEAIDVLNDEVLEEKINYEKYFTAVAKAVLALKKQEPKQVFYQDIAPIAGPVPVITLRRCASCSHEFSEEDYKQKNPFCPCCGQALCW